MKLLIAIINNDDCPTVLSEITREGFSVTKLSTSGGFLRAGNSTLLIGVEDDKVDSVIGIIGRFSSKRTETIQATPAYPGEFMMTMPVEVKVGGATVFVLDVEKFIKL
ncbi:MAG: cyclic-di-AMP receptor [Clostridiales bacterium]|nr:cyclic-di-AMP receptor [Clostridiales bacterium]